LETLNSKVIISACILLAAGYENIGLLVLSPGAFFILGLVIWTQRELLGIEEGE
ncbi:MAG: hypothetical protein H8E74_01640, partial [Gammaproteobacteria bacterium]|nr:hypothetical protein [Gammaproteobacteria bacterium]